MGVVFVDENLLLTQYPTEIPFSSPLARWKRRRQLIPGNQTWRQTKKIFPRKFAFVFTGFRFFSFSYPLLSTLSTESLFQAYLQIRKIEERGRYIGKQRNSEKPWGVSRARSKSTYNTGVFSFLLGFQSMRG